MEHQRNFTNIALANARNIVDHCINALHDELEDAYYKFWKFGLDYDFHGYNQKANQLESKQQFDILHGMVFMLHSVLVHTQNMNLSINDREDPSRYNDIYDNDGVKIGERAASELSRLRNLTPHFVNMKKALKTKTRNPTLLTMIDGIK